MVELLVGGQKIELEKGTKIKYTKQIADVFDIASVSNSYTNSFKAPKTPNNTRVMQSLGIVGDRSDVPYNKVSAQLSDHGATLINEGWLNVKNTDDNYNLSVIDGMVDFFKAIENKTLGNDVDLSIFDHEKNIETVVGSFESDVYRYIVADYNGKVYTRAGSLPSRRVLNIDYLVPCFNVLKILDAVMGQYGYTYDLAGLDDLQGLYITYPKDPQSQATTDLYVTLKKALYVSSNVSLTGGRYISNAYMPWTTTQVNQGAMSGSEWVVPESGNYTIDLEFQAYMRYRLITGPLTFFRPMTVGILINGVEAYSILGDPDTEAVKEWTGSKFLNQGDRVSFIFYTPAGEFQHDNFLRTVHHHHTDVMISKSNQGDISLSDAFGEFSIKDFFKEIIWFTATVPVLSGKNVRFMTLDERIDTRNAIDVSRNLVRRKNESYIADGYAQKNAFRHKYNDENKKVNDGYLLVGNKNISDEKVLAESKIYAPEENLTIFEDQGAATFTTQKFRVWNTEAKEDSDGTSTLEYKGLTGRFYFIRSTPSPSGQWEFGSDSVSGGQVVNGIIPQGITFRTTYDQIVSDKYGKYSELFQNFRVMDFEMAMSITDFLSFDLTRTIYLRQEASYFLPNRLVFEEGGATTLEAVKIQRLSIEERPNEMISIRLRAVQYTSGSDVFGQLFISVPVIDGRDDIDRDASQVVVNGQSVELGSESVSNGFINMSVSINASDWQMPMIVNSLSLKSGGFTYLYQAPAISFTLAEMNQMQNKTVNASIIPE